MPKLRVHTLSMSLDGYVAGLNQSVDEPLGEGGERLHEWVFETKFGRNHMGLGGGGDEGIDNDFMAAGFEGIGAWILGRNMFGPIRGPWLDDEWKGWWGDEPPYHCDVFVLTHYERAPLEMKGGTTFHFVTDGIESAHAQAFAAAGGQDVRLGGGASVVRQYVAAGLLDEMHVAISPVLLGGGEKLFDDGGATAAGLEIVEFVTSPSVAHVRFAKSQISK